MAARRSSEDSQMCREISSHSRLPGRVERLPDRVLGQDLGTVWTHAQSACHRQTRRSRGDVCPQQTWAFVVSPARQTYYVQGSHRISGTDAATSSLSPSGGCDGSSQASYVAENQSLHREPATAAYVLPSQLFAGLEPR